MSRLTHFDAEGRAAMVDVGDKPVTARTATARGAIIMAPETLTLIEEGRAAKGDVLAVARLAGIMAAKRTADLIPLCHPLMLTRVAVDLTPIAPDRIEIEATIRTSGQTGVEMEALTAVSVAGLTVYDMVKAVDRSMQLTDIRVTHKAGGKSGEFQRTMSSGMIPVSEALERLFALIRPVSHETVPLTEATGRVLAEDAITSLTQPPFAASAMDGYAVRAAEAVTGAVLPVIGESAAGRRHDGPLPEGTVIRIFTGAPLPEGADAILIQENTSREGDRITITASAKKGAYIRPAGGDFTAGDRLSAPRRLTPRDIALLAAMNLPEITVARRPRVALIATGDELVLPGEEPGADQIVSSNNFGLAAMLTEIGAEPIFCPIALDTRESLLAALDSARGADFIVTLGGASVGEHDLVAEVFREAGLSLDFWKIRMRPGKPLMVGQVAGAVMLGLPGNPVSTMVCGEVFLRPAVDAAMGLPARPRATRPARLAHAIGPNGGREHYMRAEIGDDGRVAVFGNQDSSLLGTLARSNALIVRAPDAPALPEGAEVQYIPL